MHKHDPNKIIEYLSTQEEPQAVETIRVNTGISHWSMTLAHCLELYVAGRIAGMKTSKSWVFWVPKKDEAKSSEGDVLVPG